MIYLYAVILVGCLAGVAKIFLIWSASIRRNIAAQAMAGILADHCEIDRVDGLTCSQSVARIAVQQADDLLAELARTAK